MTGIPSPGDRASEVHKLLSLELSENLVTGLLEAHAEMRDMYSAGRIRPSELEAGRFADWAFRICEARVLGSHTPLNRGLEPVDRLAQRLGSAGSNDDAFRLHIPRVLLGVYEIRNRRDVGHPSGSLSANRVDAELVITTTSWVVAEMLRQVAGLEIEHAQAIVDSLVERRSPAIEEIDGFVKILDPSLPLNSRIFLLLLHHSAPTKRAELARSLETTGGTRLNGALAELSKSGFIHETGEGWVLTKKGIPEAERIASQSAGRP